MPSLKKILSKLFIQNQSTNDAAPYVLDEHAKSLLDCLTTTLEHEADCAEFDAKMDCLAEMLAQGKIPSEVVPAEIHAHLLHSGDCREEFDALVAILKAQESGEFDTNK